MPLRETNLSPLFRTLATLALMVFVVAQSMCFVHCQLGGRHGDKAQPSCHSSPQRTTSRDADDHSESPSPSPTTACSTFKTMLVGSDAPTLTSFQIRTLYLLPSVVLALDATETLSEAAFSRQPHPREWTFTPEVCLNPAFRSLAPPSVG